MDRAHDHETCGRGIDVEEQLFAAALNHAALPRAELLRQFGAQGIGRKVLGLHQPLLAIGDIGDHDNGTARGALDIHLFQCFEFHDWPTFSTKTRMVPPQDRPTFQAVSSATPNSSILGLPLAITSSASVTTAPSTQPPETDPKNVPSSLMTRLEPAGRGAEPQVSTTVASATPWPAFCQFSAACRMSSSRLSILKPFQAAERMRLMWCGGGAAESASISLSIEVKLCTGRNSSTYGSIILIPCALASKAL